MRSACGVKAVENCETVRAVAGAIVSANKVAEPTAAAEIFVTMTELSNNEKP